MYPELFSIGSFSVSTFGVMLAIAFLVGTKICAVRLEEEGQDPEQAWNLLLWMMFGGILGSKLYFAVDVSIRTGESFSTLLLSRAGITWYGGLIGGATLTPPDDPRAFAEAITAAAADRPALARAARAHVEAHHSLAAAAATLKSSLAELLS